MCASPPTVAGFVGAYRRMSSSSRSTITLSTSTRISSAAAASRSVTAARRSRRCAMLTGRARKQPKTGSSRRILVPAAHCGCVNSRRRKFHLHFTIRAYICIFLLSCSLEYFFKLFYMFCGFEMFF